VASFNAVLVFLLCLALIPKFGVVGAALSMAITMVVRNVATVVLARYFLGKKLNSPA
jgi:Na+-driven multidrug efflux pump